MDPNTKELRLRLAGVVLGAVFLASGLTKWVAAPMQVRLFEELGLPMAAMFAIGTLELIAAVLVVIRRTHAYGAMIICLIMAGAIITHVMTGVALPLLFANALLFATALWVVINHRPGFLLLRTEHDEHHPKGA